MGVGSSETVVRKSAPPSPCAPGPNRSDAVGVGRRLAAPESVGLPLAYACDVLTPSDAVGVGRPGNDEDPESAMWGSDIGSA